MVSRLASVEAYHDLTEGWQVLPGHGKLKMSLPASACIRECLPAAPSLIFQLGSAQSDKDDFKVKEELQ